MRQLENVVQRALVIAEGSSIEIWHLPAAIRSGFSRRADDIEGAQQVRSYEYEVRDFKRRLILRTLRECGWQKAETARTLQLARGYLHRLINQLEIEDEEVHEHEEAEVPPKTLPTNQVM